MLIYEPFIPFKKIKARAKRRADKPAAARRAHPAYFAAPGACPPDEVKITPPQVYRDAARYGVNIDHILNPNNAANIAFTRLLEQGYREDEIEAMSAARFERVVAERGVGVSRRSLFETHADLFWSDVDDAPLVALFTRHVKTGSVVLQRVLNADSSLFDGLAVAKEHIREAWVKRYGDALPPERFIEELHADLERRARDKPHSFRVVWQLKAFDLDVPTHKPQNIRDRSSHWIVSDEPLDADGRLGLALRYLPLHERRMRHDANAYAGRFPSKRLRFEIHLGHVLSRGKLTTRVVEPMARWVYDPQSQQLARADLEAGHAADQEDA